MITPAEILEHVSWVKWRVYRFSDSLEAHVCAEVVEDRVREGRVLPRPVVEELGRFLLEHRASGGTVLDVDLLAAAFDVDPGAEVRRRLDVRAAGQVDGPLIVLTGPPRSGSTDVLNRLIYATGWATLTDHSHHLWSPFTLRASAARYLLAMPAAHLDADTTASRLDSAVSWPSEGEQIFHRAIPVAKLVGAHEYELVPPQVSAAPMLRRVLSEHRCHFGTEVLVSKSPFHAFRAAAIDDVFDGVVVVVVDREQGQSAASMDRYGFRYRINGELLSAGNAEQMFRRLALNRADIVVDHGAFREDPTSGLTRLRTMIERRLQ